MKKRTFTRSLVFLLVIVSFTFSTSNLMAQTGPSARMLGQSFTPSLELSVWGGYMFGGKFDAYNYLYDIKDAADFGGALSLEVAPNYWVEFTYNIMPTTAKYGYRVESKQQEDINVNYFQLGTQKVLNVHETVKPFGMLSLGATYFNRGNSDDLWAFSGIAGAGVKIYITERVGLRLQGRFMVPMYFNGFGFGVGTGGVGGGATFGAYALQGDFSGGFIFRLK